jgi:hypothetical protein
VRFASEARTPEGVFGGQTAPSMFSKTIFYGATFAKTECANLPQIVQFVNSLFTYEKSGLIAAIFKA